MEILTGITERRLERRLLTLMTDEPVIVLNGPRTVGKSTLLRRLAQHLHSDVLDLDDLGTRELVRRDPAGFVSGPAPVLIDEFQHVPELLDAIKAELNVGTRPGRFVLTGSTRYATLPRTAQSLTGRVHVEAVWPLSQGEIAGRDENFVARLLADSLTRSGRDLGRTSREEYVERVVAGGLPEALARSTSAARNRWFDNYVDLVIARDVLEISSLRQSAVLPGYLRRLAAQTGQLINIAHASREAGIAPSSGEDYARLLESVFLVHRVPSWGATLTARVNKHPKIHLVDTGLGGRLLGLTPAAAARRVPAVMAEFGHLFETFVVNEVLKQAALLDDALRPGHYRTPDGQEVDLVLESADGDVFAIEVKAGSTIRADDASGLRHLRRRLGPRFRCGVVIYTGTHAAQLDDGIVVVPADALWRSP